MLFNMATRALDQGIAGFIDPFIIPSMPADFLFYTLGTLFRLRKGVTKGERYKYNTF